MYVELLLQLAIAIIVAVISWWSGANLEKKKHLNEINFYILKEKIFAYTHFLGDLRKTSEYTGSVASNLEFFTNYDKFGGVREELHKRIGELWADSCNPLILKDENVKKCINDVNKQIATMVTVNTLSSDPRERMIKFSDQQVFLIKSLNDLEKEVSDLFDSYMK